VTVATALAAVALFLVGMWVFGVAAAATGAIGIAHAAVATMRDPALDDRARETAIQRASIRLASGFGSIAIRGILALALSLLPVWLADAGGLAAAPAVFAFLSRPDVIVTTSAAIGVGYLAWRRAWRSS
jgi:hypothetical protein